MIKTDRDSDRKTEKVIKTEIKRQRQTKRVREVKRFYKVKGKEKYFLNFLRKRFLT